MPILKYIRSIKIKIEKYLPNHSLGFTLLELMIAVSIMAIIASIGFVSYSQTQTLARDSKRKQDARALAVALELFYQQNKRYPATGAPSCLYGGSSYCVSASGSNWIPELTTAYIKSLPKDPLSDSTNPWVTPYGYSYFNCGSGYTITSYLENSQDPESLGKNAYKFCNGSGISAFNWSNNLFIITSNY